VQSNGRGHKPYLARYQGKKVPQYVDSTRAVLDSYKDALNGALAMCWIEVVGEINVASSQPIDHPVPLGPSCKQALIVPISRMNRSAWEIIHPIYIHHADIGQILKYLSENGRVAARSREETVLREVIDILRALRRCLGWFAL
jgi:hypothetical protein